jgi:hypothetical protein
VTRREPGYSANRACREAYLDKLALDRERVKRWLGVVARGHPCVSRAIGQRQDNEDREAVIAQAREKDAHAFAQWTTKEEQEIKRRVEQGEAATDRARA